MSAAVTAVLLYLVLRSVPIREVGRSLAQTSIPLLLLAAAGAFCFGWARTWRYRVLLADRARNSLQMLTAMTFGSWGASLLLPGPSGDAVFVWLSRAYLGAALARGTGAVLMARMLDIISLLLIAVVAAPLAGVRLPFVAEAVGGLAALMGLALLAALFSTRMRRRILGWLRHVPFVSRYGERLSAALEELGTGRAVFELGASTALARLATAVEYLALFAAVGHPLGFFAVWFALSVRTLLYAIPIQGVGGFGTAQVWWTGALTLLGWPLPQALALSLVIHILDLTVSLPQGIAGWVALLLLRPRSEIDQRGREEEAAAAAR